MKSAKLWQSYALDAGKIFTGLQALLKLAQASFMGSGRDGEAINSIVEFVEPDWVITDAGVRCIHGQYEIPLVELEAEGPPPAWIDLASNDYFDGESFRVAKETALALYYAAKLETKPPGYVEEPPV